MDEVDPAVRDALAATRAELAAVPAPELPPEVAARWTAALAAEAARSAPAARRPRRPRLVAAAAAVVAALGLGVAVARPAPAPVVRAPVDLVAFGREAVGVHDFGDLADPAACARTVDPAAVGERLLGGRRVTYGGRQAVVLVLATGTTGGLRILTVDPACTTRLARVEVG